MEKILKVFKNKTLYIITFYLFEYILVVEVMVKKVNRIESMVKITHKYVVAQMMKNTNDFDKILPIADEEQLIVLEEILERDEDYRSSFVSFILL